MPHPPLLLPFTEGAEQGAKDSPRSLPDFSVPTFPFLLGGPGSVVLLFAGQQPKEVPGSAMSRCPCRFPQPQTLACLSQLAPDSRVSCHATAWPVPL